MHRLHRKRPVATVTATTRFATLRRVSFAKRRAAVFRGAIPEETAVPPARGLPTASPFSLAALLEPLRGYERRFGSANDFNAASIVQLAFRVDEKPGYSVTLPQSVEYVITVRESQPRTQFQKTFRTRIVALRFDSFYTRLALCSREDCPPFRGTTRCEMFSKFQVIGRIFVRPSSLSCCNIVGSIPTR